MSAMIRPMSALHLRANGGLSVALCAAAGVIAGVTTGTEEGAEDDAGWPESTRSRPPARAAATTAVRQDEGDGFGMGTLPVAVPPSPYSPVPAVSNRGANPRHAAPGGVAPA